VHLGACVDLNLELVVRLNLKGLLVLISDGHKLLLLRKANSTYRFIRALISKV
jgi:hypothetical protein